MAIYALVVLEQTSRPSAPIGLTLNVTGATRHFATPNKIQLSIGVPVRFILRHSCLLEKFHERF